MKNKSSLGLISKLQIVEIMYAIIEPLDTKYDADAFTCYVVRVCALQIKYVVNLSDEISHSQLLCELVGLCSGIG